jgi:hypothetical protein
MLAGQIDSQGDFVCCQGTEQCTCSYNTCRCVCCSECIYRRRLRERSAQEAGPQREAPPSPAGCLLVLAAILVSIVLVVIF